MTTETLFPALPWKIDPVSILRVHLPALSIRVVKVAGLMRLQPRSATRLRPDRPIAPE
jgi:phosphoketolase